MYTQTTCDICNFPGLCIVENNAEGTPVCVCGTCQDDFRQRRTAEEVYREECDDRDFDDEDRDLGVEDDCNIEEEFARFQDCNEYVPSDEEYDYGYDGMDYDFGMDG